MIAKDSVAKFVAYWRMQSGSERSQCHQFWDSLLGEVLGITDLKRFIEYEKPLYFNDGTTKSLDARIPSTKVLGGQFQSGGIRPGAQFAAGQLNFNWRFAYAKDGSWSTAVVGRPADYIKRNDTTLKGYGKSLYNMALVRVAVQTAYVL